jgi:hypothetical protein
MTHYSGFAKQLGTSKTDAFVALLNAGLEEADKLRVTKGRKG